MGENGVRTALLKEPQSQRGGVCHKMGTLRRFCGHEEPGMHLVQMWSDWLYVFSLFEHPLCFIGNVALLCYKAVLFCFMFFGCLKKIFNGSDWNDR